jgi:DNA-binding NarL/FixJ family response regulator
MIKMGASGYLNKIADIDKLVFAINKISTGGYYISQSLTKKLISMLKLKKDIIVNEKLNNWEFEILWMIISGKSVNEIADALMLSTAEVNKQYSNIFMKMNVDDVSGLLHHCIVNYLPVDFTYV